MFCLYVEFDFNIYFIIESPAGKKGLQNDCECIVKQGKHP